MDEKLGVLSFLEYLKVVKKRSSQTLRQYHSILREFQRFEPLTSESWKRYLKHIAKNAPKTQQNKLKVVKQYLNWKADKMKIPIEDRFWKAAEAPKAVYLPKALTEPELKAFLASVDNPFYKALFRLMVNTGLRIGEILNLSLDQISFYDNFASIRVIGKGNKERIITISKDLIYEAINNGVFDKKISARAVEKAIKKYAQKAGLKNITPHTLRHTFAVLLLKRGKPINEIQALLGHSNIATTSIYLQVASDTIKVPILM